MAGTLRITGGTLARRRIDVPAAADAGLVRPTTDKVREALMSALAPSLPGVVVVDLFAGSGALGFEALSRGAASCTFVEADRKTAQVIRDNAKALGVVDQCTIVVADCARFVAGQAPESADLVFADPPYARELLVPFLDAVTSILRADGQFVLERDKKSADLAPVGLSLGRDRVYGGTRVVIYEKKRDEKAPMPTAAIYPGSFDPLTNGHVDIVTRGLKMFDRVIVAIANNQSKTHAFTPTERVEMARRVFADVPGVEVDTFNGLVVEYAKKRGVHVLLRGLRAVSDFEYEFQLASMNRKIATEVETAFMMTSEENFYLSSRLVREVASYGADVQAMVPGPVHEALLARFAKKP
jgi:pantetheine-phosphate adenylyltransferase